MNIDSTMKELAEYIRMGEEIAANIDALKDALKKDAPEIAAKYTRTTESRRFTFA